MSPAPPGGSEVSCEVMNMDGGPGSEKAAGRDTGSPIESQDVEERIETAHYEYVTASLPPWPLC